MDRLTETADQVRAAGGRAVTIEYDVRQRDAERIVAGVGGLTDLVLSAGLNSPRRSWADHSIAEFEQIVSTNLIGVADVVTAALPHLRGGSSSIVVVSSLSAWTTSPGAGVAYRASKTALRSLTESINEQEARHGIRATHLCPGDIATDFLDHRPSPPDTDARSRMLTAADVARAVVFALSSPPHLRIDELVLSPLGTLSR